jgi:hypothetical protein
VATEGAASAESGTGSQSALRSFMHLVAMLTLALFLIGVVVAIATIGSMGLG